MGEQLEVRTRSLATAAVLVMLGHEIQRVQPEVIGTPTIHFTPDAEADLRRYLLAKQHVERRLAAQ